MIKSLLVLVLVTFSFSAFAVKTKSDQKIAMEAILAEFRTHYGMAKYKKRMFNVTFDSLRKKYGRLISEAKTLEEELGFDAPQSRRVLPPDEFRQLMIGMVAEFRDGHDSLLRQGTEVATLGFLTATVGEKMIVSMVRPDLLVPGTSTESIQAGDEVVSFNGVPVQELAKRNFIYASGGTFEHRWDIAMTSVAMPFEGTYRLPKEGERVNVVFRRGGRDYRASLRWVYRSDYQILARRFPMHIQSPFEKMFSENVFAPYGLKGTVRSYFGNGLININSNIIKIGEMLNNDIRTAQAEERAGAQERTVDRRLARLNPVTRMPLYVVRHKDKNVAVLRVPSYHPAGGVQAVHQEFQWLAEGLRRLQDFSDVLVIDQVANPGGYLFYLSKMLSLFTLPHSPMQTVLVDHKLNETVLRSWNPANALGNGARPVEHQLYENYYKQLKARFEAGEEWTGLIAAFDLQLPDLENVAGEVFPAAEGVYTKPILLLNDHMSGSCGDFFPAVMQYNGRATIMGETSCGLGGPLYRKIDSMPGSEMSLCCTYAYAELPNGVPIENIGVLPNIRRNIEVHDVREGFQRYAREVLDNAVALVGVESAPARSVAFESVGKDQTKLAKLVDKLDPNNANSYIAGLAQITELAKANPTLTWRNVVIALPPELMSDMILVSISRRLEVMNRLTEMKGLPEFQDSIPVIDALIELSGAAGEGLVFGFSCAELMVAAQ